MASKELAIGKCFIDGCGNKAQFFIGSLTLELQGKQKWLYVCPKCEAEIAAENGKIQAEAKLQGFTIVDYITNELRGIKCKRNKG